MAKETVDRAVEVFGFNVGPSITEHVRLVGSENWSKNMFIGLVQRVSGYLFAISWKPICRVW